MAKDRFSESVTNSLLNYYQDDEYEDGKNNLLIQNAYDDYVTKNTTLLYEKLKNTSAIMLEENRLVRTEFESRLLRRWLKPLHLLEMLSVLSLEAVEELYKELRDEEEGQDIESSLFIALIQIHSRAIQIAQEIQCLMRSGFPDGAFSRWRTLHELSVLTYFLNDYGDELAEMYLDYKYIDNYNEMQEYRQYAEELGTVALSDDEIFRITHKRDMLIEKYGQGYEKNYGWTKNVLTKEKRNFKGVEEHVEMNHFRESVKNFV